MCVYTTATAAATKLKEKNHVRSSKNAALTGLFLFQYGADPNKLDLHGRTPLVCAIRGCRLYPWNGLNVIKAILRFGCDVNLRGKFDLSVIMAQEEQAYSTEDLRVWHCFFFLLLPKLHL